MIIVECRGNTCEFPEGSTFADAAKRFRHLYDSEPLLAEVTGAWEVLSLFQPIKRSCKVEFLTYRDSLGRRAYLRTAEFLMLRAIHDLTGKNSLSGVRAEFDVDGNLFMTFSPEYPLEEAFATQIREKMLEYVQSDDPIVPETLLTGDCAATIEEKGLEDLTGIMSYRTDAALVYMTCGDYSAYFCEPLCSSAGCIRSFDIRLFADGIMIVVPTADSEDGQLNPVCQSVKTFDSQRANARWAKNLGFECTSGLNRAVCDHSISHLIRIQEAYFEKQLGDIAQKVAESRKQIILLAGPSSSGKTTTAYRLAIQLKALGLKPCIISADNYYKNRCDVPLDENGEPDLETIDALDLELFNSNLMELLAGKTVTLPIFDFPAQRRADQGRALTLAENSVLIIEGIHCLNPMMTNQVDEKSKFRVYLSALTPLNINDFNSIITSDMRLLRRICRDARTRGRSAGQTIALWGQVRRGEAKYILPYQDNADVVLNTSMLYEISALKLLAEPQLYTVSRTQPEYAAARALLHLLSYVLPLGWEDIPSTSILREFIGGSCISD